SLAARQITWLQYGLRDVLHDDTSSVLRYDNKGSGDLAAKPRIHNRSKHIDIHYHFVREKYEQGDFNLIRVDGNKNLAYYLTKALGNILHQRYADHIRYAKRGEVL